MKKQLTAGQTILILLIAFAIIGGAFCFSWIFGGKEKGMSMSEAFAQDKKNAAARAQTLTPPPTVSGPKPKMVNVNEIMKGHLPDTGAKKPDQKAEQKHDAKTETKQGE